MGRHIHIEKAFLYALVLAIEELRKFIDKSRTKQPERLMWCIIYILISFGCILHSLVGRIDYILTLAWGFRRCSFQLVGQCEGLSIVERVTELAPRFLYVCKSKDTNR